MQRVVTLDLRFELCYTYTYIHICIIIQQNLYIYTYIYIIYIVRPRRLLECKQMSHSTCVSNYIIYVYVYVYMCVCIYIHIYIHICILIEQNLHTHTCIQCAQGGCWNASRCHIGPTFRIRKRSSGNSICMHHSVYSPILYLHACITLSIAQYSTYMNASLCLQPNTVLV